MQNQYFARPMRSKYQGINTFRAGVSNSFSLGAGGHINLTVAFKGLNVIFGLYKCNYSLTRGKELSAAAGPNKTRWRVGIGPWALRLPPVI